MAQLDPSVSHGMAYKYFLHLDEDFGQVFSNIGVYEVQKSASVAFTNFGNAHW